MRIAAVDSVDMKIDPNLATADFTFKSSKLEAALLLVLGIGGMLCLLAPIALIALDALANPHVVNTLSANIGSTALLSTGVILAAALLLYPLRAGLNRLSGNAKVRMADGMVHFHGKGLTGPETWRAPLAQFCGVTHHIRATLSGPRHEIILVHADPEKDILLHVAPRHPKEDAVHFAELLGLAQLQPKTLYSRHRSRPHDSTSVELQAHAA